ncbi:hypothetical protein DPMN_081948 [Dreissena polymorpha]|uniref:Uncharacterized protein n=1 Tax=Dreissena polymorpha TaxID=45954 RepID=A0A9D4BIA7_DREPO|nr:hypothetical protein DPMN_081948 [Dreissena polymorpha]
MLLHDNRLEKLLQALGTLQNVQRLDVSRNILTEIPIFVAKIQSLKSLHVEHNQLASIPEDIGTLMFLEELQDRETECLQQQTQINTGSTRVHEW